MTEQRRPCCEDDQVSERVKPTKRERLSLIPPMPLLEMARAFHAGAQKYEDFGYMKAPNLGKYVDAMLRHVVAFMAGEDVDPETGIHHLAHAACNAFILQVLQAEGEATDDRYATADPTVPVISEDQGKEEEPPPLTDEERARAVTLRELAHKAITAVRLQCFEVRSFVVTPDGFPGSPTPVAAHVISIPDNVERRIHTDVWIHTDDWALIYRDMKELATEDERKGNHALFPPQPGVVTLWGIRVVGIDVEDEDEDEEELIPAHPSILRQLGSEP